MGRGRIGIVAAIATTFILACWGCDDLTMRDHVSFLSGTGPQMVVQTEAGAVTSDTLAYDFGAVLVGASNEVMDFAISNEGFGDDR